MKYDEWWKGEWRAGALSEAQVQCPDHVTVKWKPTHEYWNKAPQGN